MLKGICPVCGKGPRSLPYRNPDDKKQNICHACYARIKRYRSKGISRSMPEPKVKKEKKTEGRKIKYPDKEAVEAALKARMEASKENYASVIAVEDMTLYRKAKEFGVSLLKKEIQRRNPVKVEKVSKSVAAEKRTNTAYFTRRPRPAKIKEEPRRKNGRKIKYPTRELVIAVLENREVAGRENFAGVLQKEDFSLYRASRLFEVELPLKGDSQTQYCLGDLVKNQNQKDPEICGKIGRVVYVSEKETKVNFGEAGRIIRVYEKWRSLRCIVLYACAKRRLAEKPKQNKALVY